MSHDESTQFISKSERIQRLLAEIVRRRGVGEKLSDDQVAADHPELMPELGDELRKLGTNPEQTPKEAESTKPSQNDTVSVHGGPRPAPDRSPENNPQYAPGDKIHRYVVQRILGEGHFGTVYLARDENLGRDVAVKVPRPERLVDEVFVEQYLQEAHTVARLEHEGIVPIYDADRLNETCFVVYKHFAGGDLQQLVLGDRPAPSRAAELIADVAEALAYVHRHRIVHRDLKPANIFLDEATGPAMAGRFWAGRH